MPFPHDPYETSFFSGLAAVMSSGSVWKGELAGTTSTEGTNATLMIGAKSFFGSKGICEKTAGLIAKELLTISSE